MKRLLPPHMWMCILLLSLGATLDSLAQDVSDENLREEESELAGEHINEGHIDDTNLEAYVDGLIAAWQAEYGAPGYTLSVVRPDRVIFSKGYGLADVENKIPVDAKNTRFHVASISKTFVFTAAMMLVEQGVLDLHRDVNEYLTRYQVPEGERPLTLNDLVSHRSGFEESLTVFTPEATEMELPDALKFTQPEQAFPRGENTAYSNWATNLIALMIEDATGRDYADYLFNEILIPLGMNTTTLTGDSTAAQLDETPSSKNYWVNSTGPQETEQLELGSFAPVAGMTTTAADMARWMRFHLGRGELDGVRLMSQDSYDLLRIRNFDPVPGAAGRSFGFADIPYRNTHYYGHSGSINSFYSMFAIAPELELGVFISQNTTDSFGPLSDTPTLIFDRELRQRDDLEVMIRPLPKEEDIASAEEIAGSYLSNRRVYNGLEKMVAMMLGTTDLSASDGYLIGDASNAPYVQINTDVWENRWGDRLSVLRDDNGEVLRLISSFGEADLEPVTLLTDPKNLLISVVVTMFFSVLAWLGLFRRWGRVRETTGTGRFLSVLALFGIAPLVGIAIVMANVPPPGSMSFAELFSEWPLPEMVKTAVLATIAVGVALIALMGLLPAWKSSGWPLPRRLNYSLFALAYVVTAILFINWGLAPYWP